MPASSDIIATPLPVEFSVEPFEDGKVLYQRVGPRTKGESARGMIYFMMKITNNTGKTLRLKGIEVSFPDTLLAPLLMLRDEDLKPGTREEWMDGDASIKLGEPPAKIKIRLVFAEAEISAFRIWPLARHATSYAFFARPETNSDFGECLLLPGKHFLGGGSQHFGYDVNVLGLNKNTGKLSPYKTDGATNADSFVWERPIYAMADGIVVRAVDKHPDNPSPPVRSFARKAGEYVSKDKIKAVSVANLAASGRELSRMVVAVVSEVGPMRLIALEQTQNGDALGFVAEGNGPAAEQVSVARVRETLAVTASRSGSTVTLTLWSLPLASKTLDALSSLTFAGTAEVKVVGLTKERVLTVARTSSGGLSLAVWGIKSGQLQPTPLGSGTAGAIGDFEVVTLDAGTRAVVAVRQGDGNLKLIVWDLKPDLVGGVPVVRRGDALAGNVTEVALTRTAEAGQVNTPVRLADGTLKLITWDVDAEGQVLRRGDVQSGKAALIQAAFFKTKTLATAFKTEAGKLQIIAWSLEQDETTKIVTHTQGYEQSAGGVGLIAVDQVPTDQPTFVTAVRTESGQLKVILWQYTDSNLIYILYGNEMVAHVHLRQGSIPDALLADAPVPVKRGDFIGRMGHSGKSSGPHLHIHALRIRPDLLQNVALLRAALKAGEPVGDFRPLHFHGVKAMHNVGVKPGGPGANPVTDFDGHGVYFDNFVVWP